MTLRTLVAVNAALWGSLAVASGGTVSYLSTFPSNWVAYAGAPLPVLTTTSPGSIVDAASSGSSYGRLSASLADYPGNWRIGDTYNFQFTGVVSHNTSFRMEFSNGAATVPALLGLQFVIVNATSDSIQIGSLGGTSASLLSAGNLGGVVGSAAQVVGNLSLSILAGNQASVSGTVSDSQGTLWSGPSATINLGAAPSAFYAGLNVNAGGGVSGINNMNWTLTPVPEPGSIVLFAGCGLAGLWFGRRRRENR